MKTGENPNNKVSIQMVVFSLAPILDMNKKKMKLTHFLCIEKRLTTITLFQYQSRVFFSIFALISGNKGA